MSKSEGKFEMKIIKRNGSEVTFDKEKIIKAISKANCAVA